MDSQKILDAYWWQGPPRNFGDLLTPLILNHFSKITAVWCEPDKAQIVAAGSVLDVLPSTGWRGVVAGSGKLHAETATDLTGATVLGLRGRLTAADVTVSGSSYVLGDPGLLASEMVTVDKNKYDIGVVPHWTDTDLYEREASNARRYKYGEVTLIDITEDPLEVIRKIGSCEKIVSSSLHGVIVADSFGIPRRAERFTKMSSPHEGGIFKFVDYASAIGQPLEFGKLQYAPRDKIELIQTELFEMLRSI